MAVLLALRKATVGVEKNILSSSAISGDILDTINPLQYLHSACSQLQECLPADKSEAVIKNSIKCNDSPSKVYEKVCGESAPTGRHRKGDSAHDVSMLPQLLLSHMHAVVRTYPTKSGLPKSISSEVLRLAVPFCNWVR